MRPDAGQDRQYSPLDLALSLAGAGFAVFPLAGKTPPPGFKWKDRASADPQVIVAEFAGLPASVSNVGIACGPSGVLVIDEDEADAFTKACADAGQPVPDTYRVQTGSHGRQHWYFRAPDGGLGNQVGRFKGRHIDVRGQGGYVVAAGSTHPTTGAVYRPVNGSTVAPLPGWIREWLTTEADEAAEGPRRPRFVLPDRIRAGGRHNVIVSYASQLRAQDITLDEAMAAVSSAWKRCDQPPVARWEYPLSEALQTVRDVYRRYRAGPSAGGAAHAPHPDDPGPTEPGRSTTAPRLIRRKASMIQPRRVRWLWDEQIPLGALSLLGGAAGMGKSTIAYDLAAAITAGTLPGEFYGRPRTVVAISTEDAWSYTIVPRLIAGGADLERVEQITVDTKGDLLGRVELGRDLRELEAICADPEVAVLLLDPLMSRLSAALDAHKDQQVRQELEPLVAALDRTGTTGLGLIHLTKAVGGTLLSRIMGSAAFGAVARSVVAVIDDPVPDDTGTDVYRLLGVVKSNVAKIGHAHRYQVVGAQVATEDGPTEVGRVLWCGPVPLTLEQAAAGAIDPEQAPAQADAAAWLLDVMTQVGASGIAFRDVEKRAKADGIDMRSLQRVRARVGVATRRGGFPSTTTWYPPS